MISRIRQTFVFHADKVINILYNHCVIEGERAQSWNLKPRGWKKLKTQFYFHGLPTVLSNPDKLFTLPENAGLVFLCERRYWERSYFKAGVK